MPPLVHTIPDEIYGLFPFQFRVPTVLAVGNLVPRKGHLHLIRAARWAGIAGYFWNVVIIGEGPLHGDIYSEWDEDPQFRLQIKPRIPEKELHELYDACDVVCIPSVTDSCGLKEGLGLVALEALAHHKPVVGFSNGGLLSIVSEGVGVLVSEGDEVALAQGIVRMLSFGVEPADCDRVVERFSWNGIRRDMAAMFDGVGFLEA